MGLAIGFKDGGGVNKPALARVKVSTGGDIFLQCGTAEIGQGAHTALSAVVAERLGADGSRVRYMPVDTDHTPFDQGTNASSAISVMGQAVDRAALAARRQILDFAAEKLDCPADELDLADWEIRRGNEAHPLAPMIMGHFGGTGWEFVGEGFHKAENSHAAPLEAPCVFWEIGWGGAQVAVDTGTGQVTVEKLFVTGDAGRAIHPLVCRGQDEGAALMGLSQALFERMVYDGARLVNGDALTYPGAARRRSAGGFPLRHPGAGPRPRPVRRQGHGRRRHAAGRQRHRQRDLRRRRRAPHGTAAHARAGPGGAGGEGNLIAQGLSMN